MASNERRNAIALDDAYFYCRLLETGTERPDLFRLCNAIRTVDLALENHDQSPIALNLSADAWSCVRDSLFNYLVSNIPGYFIIYPADGSGPLETQGKWPESGQLEFFPLQSNRKNDSYTGRLESLRQSVLTPLRWKFAEGSQEISPSDFEREEICLDNTQNEPDPARDLLMKFNEICEEQANLGKKKAHRIWWQLYWEASSCPNRKAKNELQKQMVALQSIWGRPSHNG